MLINRTGTFRGKAIEAGVSQTPNGFPQYTIKCRADEYWDAEMEQWLSWAGIEENELTAYLTLFDKNGKLIFHAKDIQATFGWDGTSLSGLHALDVSKTEFQFTVEEHVYNEKSSLQVTKVARYDSVPGQTIRKCDPAALKALDAKFGAALLKNAAPVKPASAPAKKTTMPKPPKTEKPKPVADVVEPAKIAAPPKRTAVVDETANAPAPAAPVTCTMEEAWERCVTTRKTSVTDEQLAQAWGKAAFEVAGDAKDEDITAAQWATIAAKVTAECGDDIPF